MSKPKRHHVVPQMLLRRFAPYDDADRIWQLSVTDDADPVRVKIENAAVVRYYYTHFRDRPYKEDEWFWEETLAEWEGHAANALRALDTDPNHLGRPAQLLVVLQLLRTPLGQALMGEQASAERTEVFSSPDMKVWTTWWAQRKGRFPEIEEWQVLREAAKAAQAGEDHPLLAVGSTAILDEMMTVVQHSGFGERLTERGDWNILNAPWPRFVIGDEPVTYQGQHEPARPIWAQSELPAALTMPISPTQCIEVRRDTRHRGIDDDEIDAINLRAFEWATQFVYGPDPSWLVECLEDWRRHGCPTPPPRGRTARRRR
ncbi:MAG TPA: DUF4238 domain-containing protein [Solirubrobacteraceae bacterium]|jgi:hypothetical protein|nr:DUF4238 domain-containing protein [Solirubrobacteraceae bacterium]